eukprot:TRINITY_DN5990_c0_g1_i1.p1 TRINITY_DN5990_c0_g1~~TRINITY_DN5990_c0_g1_i1.p1  ORF type:complete len:467 (-),score=99.03 TRINITY_DN5990_c0_g1_i1:304-1704(-)
MDVELVNPVEGATNNNSHGNTSHSASLIVTLFSFCLKLAKLWFDVLTFPIAYVFKTTYSMLLKLILPTLEQINRVYITPSLNYINKNKYNILKYGIAAWSIFAVSITLALLTYLILYYFLIPKVYTATPLYFDFEHPSLTPHSTTYLSFNTFQPDFKYHVSIVLEMPESKENTNLGMFMVQLNVSSPSQIQTPENTHFVETREATTEVKIPFVNNTKKRPPEPQNTILLQTTRPGVLRYKTSLMRIIYTIFYSPWFLIGFEEKQTLTISLTEGAILPIFDTPPFFIIDCYLSKRDIQVYSASLQIHTELSGWRYWMKYWPVTSFLVGVVFLFCFYAFFTLLTVAYLYWNLSDTPQPTASSYIDEEISFETPLRFVGTNSNIASSSGFASSDTTETSNILSSNSGNAFGESSSPQVVETEMGSDDSNNDEEQPTETLLGEEEVEDDGKGLGLAVRKRSARRRNSTPK